MLFRPVSALIGAVVLACVPMTGAFAIGEPIPGIDIVVKKNPGPIVVRTKTDAKGEFTIKDLPPGAYTIEIDDKTLGTTKSIAENSSPIPRDRAGIATAKGAAPDRKYELKDVLVSIVTVTPVNDAPSRQTQQGNKPGEGPPLRINLTVPGGVGTKQSYKGTVAVMR
jgi:hypothetical protein